MAKSTPTKRNVGGLPPVSEQLRQAIAECGLALAELERRTGVHRSSISRFMNGERTLSSAAVDALGEVLQLEIVMHGPREP